MLCHSAVILTFIKLPYVIKIFVLSIFEWPFYRAVVGFLKVVPPLNAADVHRMPMARAGEEHERGSLVRGGVGDLPHENFVIKDD